MALHELWTIGQDGTLSAETETLRLVVCKASGHARYFVLRHPRQAGRFPQAILAAGSEADISSAMDAAEVAATRLARSPRRPVGADARGVSGSA